MILFGILLGLFIIIKIINIPTIRGKMGEEKVSNILSSLGEEYSVFDDVLLKTDRGTTQIDHIVLSKFGIFVVETKTYTGRIYGNDKNDYWTETFKTKSVKFKNPINQNYGHICALSSLLGYEKNKFISIVSFSNNADLRVACNTHVIHRKQLKEIIISYNCEILSYQDIQFIKNKLDSLNITDKEAKVQHVEDIKTKIKNDKNLVNDNICPKCRGTLVVRNGRYGKFLGCSNYPKCHFKTNL